MQALLKSLDYDFDNFTMDGFRAYLEHRRDRKLVFVPWSMPPSLTGAWLAADGCDFVFYASDTLPIHQAHIQLHEMAHMLCGHSGLKTDGSALQVFRAFRPTQETDRLMFRSAHSAIEELEAETLASLVQRQALRSARLHQLMEIVSEDFGAYLSKYLQTLQNTAKCNKS